MINSIGIGRYYNIIGEGPWSAYNKDLKIISISKVSEIDILELSIYDVFYAAYNVSESLYQEMISRNGLVYICQEIQSRDPLVGTSDGAFVYIIPDMIDYDASSELLDCRNYLWEVRTRPYTLGDKYNPVALKLDMTSIMRKALVGIIHDDVITYKDSVEVLVPEEEYNKMVAHRDNAAAKYDNYITTHVNDIAEKEAFLANQMAAIGTREEQVRVRLEQADQMLQDAIMRFNLNKSKTLELAAKEARLRATYDILVQINDSLPSGNQITIPSYDDLV